MAVHEPKDVYEAVTEQFVKFGCPNGGREEEYSWPAIRNSIRRLDRSVHAWFDDIGE